MAADISFGRTQMLQRELQAQQDFTVAELFGKTLSKAPNQKRALVSVDHIQDTAGEGLRAEKHQHPEYSGRTLSMEGYWRDGLHMKRTTMTYFLEDDTVSVKVMGDRSHGEGEKTLLRRHLIIKPGGNDEYTWRDMGPGSNINMFGRHIHIAKVDRRSRLWMERVGAAEGLRLGADEEMPAELVPAPPDMSERYFPIGGKRNDPGRKYMMARMGIVDKTMKDVARFNKFDGVVLAFNCVWDDPSLGHSGLREFTLKYYMVDDTIEIQEVGVEKSLVKRASVPRRFDVRQQDLRPLAPGSTETNDFLLIEDIEVGSTIDVFGRPFRIFDADPPTRQLATKLLNRTLAPSTGAPPRLGVGASQPLRMVQRAVPEALGENGRPRAPTGADRPWVGETNRLSYVCRLVSRRPEDAVRRFDLTLDVASEESSLAERPQIQFGIAGGPVLKPTKVPFVAVRKGGGANSTPVSWRGHGCGVAPEMASVAGARLLGPTDCYVGATVDVLARTYEILSADDTTHAFMERYPDYFPSSNAALLVRTLGSKCAGRGDAMRTAARGLDPRGGGALVSTTDFEQWCAFFDLGLPEQEVAALGRQFTEAESGGIRLTDLIDAITS